MDEPHYVIEKAVMLQTMLSMQLKEVNHAGNIHIAQYDPDFVFRIIDAPVGDVFEHKNEFVYEVELHGYKVRLRSQRYVVFRKSCTCVICGVEGTVMCLDTKPNDQKHGRAHFNLYGIMPSGRVVMMTKDHIVPKSEGGTNELDNYQTMCETCNHEKGSDK